MDATPVHGKRSVYHAPVKHLHIVDPVAGVTAVRERLGTALLGTRDRPELRRREDPYQDRRRGRQILVRYDGYINLFEARTKP